MFAGLALMVAAPSGGAPTLRDGQGLTPEAIGELLLRGKPHRPIVEALHVPQKGMNPPGMTELELVEAPVIVPGGCTRRRWMAAFLKRPNDTAEDAGLFNIYSGDEVGLSDAAGCAQTHFVKLQPASDTVQAFQMLRTFQKVADGSLRVAFTCKTVKKDRLCRSSATILAGLAGRPPWVLSTEDGSAEIWLQDDGGTVTTIRFRGEQPRRVSVVRDFPAPF
jgi:hypothetical protein